MLAVLEANVVLVDDEPQRAHKALSSMGLGGTTDIAVVEQAPTRPSDPPAAEAQPAGPCLVPLSAHDDATLRDARPRGTPRRAHHRQGLAVVAIDGPSGPSLAAALESLASGVETRTGEVDAVLEDLAKRYMGGATLDFEGLYPRIRRVVDLPRCPWQHQTYWLDRAQPRAEGPRDRHRS